jgi:hypothetical protein
MLFSWVNKNSFAIATLLLLSSVSHTGCSTLVWNKNKSQYDTTALKTEGYDIRALSSQNALATLPPSDKPSIVLEVHHNGRHMERIPLPTDRPWFVQDLITEAEIQKRIGVTNIRIIRPVAPPGPPLVLDVPVSADGKDVNAGQNYSLCPGDMVIVKANNMGIFERMVPPFFRGGEQ